MKKINLYVRLTTMLCCLALLGQAQPKEGNAGDVNLTGMSTDEMYELSLEQLLNMSVSVASKSDQKISDAPGAVSVLSKDDLNRFGGTTLKDILVRVPGLAFSTVYMTDRSMIASRGDQVPNASCHMLLLINGRPVRETLEGGIKSEIYESFPVSIIEKIEVIRGPGSVLYGSNAFSGVINVITESADKNNVDVSAIIGNGGAYGALAEAKIKSGKFNMIAAGRLFKKREWETPFTYPDPNAADGSSTSGLTVPNEGPGAYLEMNYGNLKGMASYTEWSNSYTVSDYMHVFPASGQTNWKKTFADVGYNLNATDDWTMDFNVTYTRSQFDVSSWPATNRDSYELVGEWSNTINPIDKLGIVFGGLYNYMSGQEWGPTPDSPKFYYTDAHRYSVGAYAQANYKLLSNLNLIGGVQANKVQDIDLNVVPRAGLIWYPFEKFNVKAFYGQAFRAPSINELTINFADMMGNSNLVPETVSTFDFGVGYQGEQIHAGVNFFKSDMDHIIFQNRNPAVGPMATYLNGQAVEFTGVEFESKWYINQKFLFTGSFLYQENENEDGFENVTPIANFGAKAGLSYMSNGLTLSLFDMYQGDLEDSYKALPTNPPAGSYNLLNFYGKYNFKNLFDASAESLSLFIQVDNLLNEEIWLPDWGLSPGKSIPYNQGRAIYLGLNFALN